MISQISNNVKLITQILFSEKFASEYTIQMYNDNVQ